MKGLACAKCYTLRTFPRTDLKAVCCDCGNVVGWWLNGQDGTARYSALDHDTAYGVGFNNHFLTAAFGRGEVAPFDDPAWRGLHEQAAQAPGYLFDASRRNCWVVFFKPGTALGVEWATDEERNAVLPKEPPGQ